MIRFFAIATMGLSALVAQTPQHFEVASIKPCIADPHSSGMTTGHGRLNASCVTLKRSIMGAYGVGPNQVVGGLDWLDSERFDIVAKAETPEGDHGLMAMLQTLLTERFHLALHREDRPIQAYLMEVGKNGPKLEKGDGTEGKTDNGRGNLVVTNTTMDRFAEVLSRQMDLPVINHTALDGVFNVKLKWTPESARAAADGATADGPSVFTAIQEQLGLRLRAQKVPVEVLVIDHAEKPSAN
jgi:uncharacterized protein (TIGR03435 family)